VKSLSILVLAIAVLAACPGKKKDSSTIATGSGTGLTHLVKKTVVSWGFSQTGANTDVFLATTDETGAQVSHPVGGFPGTCEKITAAKEMNAIIAAKCATEGQAGIELHAVKQTNEIIVLKMSGATADPMAREERPRLARRSRGQYARLYRRAHRPYARHHQEAS
jgi:hypothetical protein